MSAARQKGEDRDRAAWSSTRGNAFIRVFVGHAFSVYAVAFSPDGGTIVTGSDDNTARTWNAETGQVLQVFDRAGFDVWSVAFSNDASMILAANVGSIIATMDFSERAEGRRDYPILF